MLRLLLTGAIYFFVGYIFWLSREEARIFLASSREQTSGSSQEGVVTLFLTEEAAVWYKGSSLPSGENITITSRLRVGRGMDNDLVINSPLVSLHHAEIKWEGGLWLRDLHSLHGTFLNKEKVSGHILLKPGDKVKIGPVILVVR